METVNLGAKWTDEIDAELVRRARAREPIAAIARALGRTEAGVRSRLTTLARRARSGGSTDPLGSGARR